MKSAGAFPCPGDRKTAETGMVPAVFDFGRQPTSMTRTMPSLTYSEDWLA